MFTQVNERDECTILWYLMNKKCSNAVQLQKSLKTNDKIEASINTVCRALRRNGLMAKVKQKNAFV